MPIATFGKKVFGVSSSKVYTFAGFSFGGSLDTETQEKIGDKPSTYIKGGSLDNLSFDIPLRVDFGMNVRQQIEDWQAIKDAAKPYQFILGNKPLGNNKWLLKSVNVTDTGIDAGGQILKATLKLEFEEFVRVGKKTATTNKTNATPGVAPTQQLVPQELYKPTTKVDNRRTNPNLAVAKSRGPLI
jgi:hypothetical protein